MSPPYNIGQDGLALNTNSLVARDAYGFSLKYFAGDYSGINASVTPFAALPPSLPGDINGVATGKQLFNGNIAAMAVDILVLGKGIVTTVTTGDSTFYVRDASGNVMSVYNKKVPSIYFKQNYTSTAAAGWVCIM